MRKCRREALLKRFVHKPLDGVLHLGYVNTTAWMEKPAEEPAHHFIREIFDDCGELFTEAGRSLLLNLVTE